MASYEPGQLPADSFRCRISVLDRRRDGPLDVGLEQDALSAQQRRSSCGKLLQDLTRITPLLNHAADSVYLAANPGKPLQKLLLLLVLILDSVHLFIPS